MTISENIFRIKKEIENARLKGKKSQKTSLVVVTKQKSIQQIQEVIDCGQIDLGENRANELEEKAPEFPFAKWHFIGNLQSNKTAIVVELCELIHSVDSVKLLRKINETAREIDKIQNVLLEVNVSQEPSKHGFKPHELPSVLDTLRQLPFENIKIKGLMAMAPLTEPEKTRPFFKQLFGLAQELHLRELSMGMSNDYIVAVEEGATIARIGTAIFKK